MTSFIGVVYVRDGEVVLLNPDDLRSAKAITRGNTYATWPDTKIDVVRADVRSDVSVLRSLMAFTPMKDGKDVTAREFIDEIVTKEDSRVKFTAWLQELALEAPDAPIAGKN